MAKTKKYLTTAAILVVFAIALVFVGRYTGFLGSLVSPSDGFILYGQSDVSITNQTCQTAASSGGFPGMTTCRSSFYAWSYNECQFVGGGCSPSSGVDGSDVDLHLFSAASSAGSSGQEPILQTTQDFAGKEVKVDVTATTGGNGGGGNTVTISTSNGLSLVSESIPGSSSFQGAFELQRQVFSNTTDVYWKGQLVKTYATPTNEKLIFSTRSGNSASINTHFTNLRYLPTFSCQLSSTDLLGMESFSGSTTSAITLQPSACNNSTNVRCLRYPVKSFCIDNRAILTDATQSGSKATSEPYQILIGGNQVPLTGTQTLTLFYVIDNSAGLIPTQCSIQKAYNVNNGTCTDLTGVVNICSQGVLDSTTGLCVVQPSVSCAAGVYNNSTGQCVYTPPTGVSCPTGYNYDNASGNCLKTATPVTACTNGRLDLSTNTCIYNPPVATVCNNGTYNNATGMCELHIDTSCPSGFTFDPASQSCKAPTVYAQQQAASTAAAQSSAASTQTTSTSASTNVPALGSATTTISYSSVAWWYSSPSLAFVALLILLSILYLIFFTGRNGKTRWSKFKLWIFRNKEGMFVGGTLVLLALFWRFYLEWSLPILGPVLDLLRQSYPVWVIAFVLEIIFIFAGGVADAIYKPKE